MLLYRSVPSSSPFRSRWTAALLGWLFACAAVGSAQAQTTCTIRWAAAADGLWTDAAAWAEQRVPERTDHVCIQAAGSYTVRLAEYAEAASITVGKAGSTPTLLVNRGERGGFVVLDSLIVESTGTLVFDGGGMQLYEKGRVAGTVELRNGANVYGTAIVRVTGRFTVAPSALAYWVSKQLDVTGSLELQPRSFLEVRAGGVDAMKAPRAEQTPVPSDSILPALHLRASSELRLIWGNAVDAEVSGQVRIIGDAVVDGGLTVERGAGTSLTSGVEYPFLQMRWDSLQGGFTRTAGLNDPSTGLALMIGDRDSPTEAMQFVLRAGPPRSLQALTSASPSVFTSGGQRAVRVRGQGLHAPMEVWLACTSCQMPEVFSRLDGRMQTANDTSGTAVFDLSDPRIAGSYALTLRDANGTTASVPVTIGSGALRLTIRLLEAETAEGSSQVARAVIRNAWAPYEDNAIQMEIGGTATLNEDFGMDVLPGELVLPRGQDSVVVSVFALRDDVSESAETVSISVPASPFSWHTVDVQILDAPAEATPYAAGVYPSQLGVGGRATVRLVGEALNPGMAVQLVGDGPALDAVTVRSESDGRTLYATFDLRPSAVSNPDVLAPGPRQVVVRTGGSVVGTLPVALVRPEVHNVSLSLDLPPRILLGRPTPVTIVVRNLSNIDLTGSPLLLGVPAGTEWSHEPANLTLPGGATWSALWPSQTNAENTQTIRLPFMRLPARGTQRLDVYLTFPSQLSARIAAAWESH